MTNFLYKSSKNNIKSIWHKLHVQKIGILLSSLLLLSQNVAAGKYSADTEFREITYKYDGNIENHSIPSIYDKKVRQNKILNSPILKELNSLHPDARWMLLIDGKWQWLGPTVFDQNLRDCSYEDLVESGYLIAVNAAFKYVFSPINMQKKLDADYYLKLHDIIIKNVDISSLYPRINTYRKGRNIGFEINDEIKFQKNDYCKKKNSLWKSDRAVYTTKFFRSDKNLCHAVNLEIGEAEKKVNIMFEEYYSKLYEIEKNGFAEGSQLDKNACIKDKKLEVIVRICQNLDQLHAFADANIRTINLVLQRMLVENNLKPSVLYDPNCLDLASTEFNINAVKAGQLRYDDVLEISKFLYRNNFPVNSDSQISAILNSKIRNDLYQNYMKDRQDVFNNYTKYRIVYTNQQY